MVPWAHQVQKPKGHVDRFSHFAGLTVMTDRHRLTDTPRYSICNNRHRGLGHIYVYGTVMRPNNTSYSTNLLESLKIDEKNVKIGQHMVKLWTRVWWQTFFGSQCSI